MIPYDTSHYEKDWCKEKAAFLRRTGTYKSVRLGSYIKIEGKTYCKIYVEYWGTKENPFHAPEYSPEKDGANY